MDRKHWMTILNSMGFVVQQLSQSECKCGKPECTANDQRNEILFDVGSAWPEVLKESGIPESELGVSMQLVPMDDKAIVVPGSGGTS